MNVSAFVSCSRALLILVGCVAFAQGPVNERLVSGESCHGINFQEQGYSIGDVTLRGPFDFPWYWTRAGSTASKLKNSLRGKPFTYSEVVTDTLQQLKGSSGNPSDVAGPFLVSVAFVVATRCDTASHVVDLAYQVYSVPPPNLLSGTPEWQDKARQAPQDAVGLTNDSNPFHFLPTGSFNGWKNISGGAQLKYQRQNFSLLAEGESSASAYHALLAATGSRNSLGNLARLDWRLNGDFSSQPVIGGDLGHSIFSAQFSATTRPFAGGNMLGRFGGLLEGGDLRTSLQASRLAPDTLADAPYVSTKLYGGIASRTSYNVFSASTGVEFASVKGSPGGYWRKVVGDVVDEFWIPIPLASHRALEIETRLSGGDIPSSRSLPLAATFFGGGAVTSFIPGESWQINSGPLIRAIPANQLDLTRLGAGARSFVSFNSTLSYPLWVKPMVPPVVQAEILPLLQGQVTTATSLLQNSYASKDPGFQAILTALGPLDPALETLKTAVAAAAGAHPNEFENQFDDCSDNILAAKFFLSQMNDATDKYALATTMPGTLADLSNSCSAVLNGQLNDAGILKAADAIAAISQNVIDKNQALQAAASTQAKNATAFISRTINTVVNNMNVLSVAPVLVVDWAKIGPSGNGIKGSRFGPGGGIRIELATYVNFTLGYAFNIHPQPGERPHALFFSIGVRDILH